MDECRACSSATPVAARRAHRVSGWVTNREDGAVEAIFEGEAAAVQAMLDWARRGPARAHVTKLEIIEEEPRGELGFSVR